MHKITFRLKALEFFEVGGRMMRKGASKTTHQRMLSNTEELATSLQSRTRPGAWA